MKLCLYSGGNREQNDKLNRELLKLLPGKRVRITYIPSAGDEDRKYFTEFKEWYGFYGLRNLKFFSLEEKWNESSVKEVLSSDAIYLSGGNTYHFLFWLKKRKFLTHLKDFVKSGGILIGLSAGSILMTPKIDIAGIPPYDCDENKVGIKNLNALGLVRFEFFPHFFPSARLGKELLKYSQTTPSPVFGVEEGSGIIIWDESTSIIGPYRIFYKGVSFKFESS